MYYPVIVAERVEKGLGRVVVVEYVHNEHFPAISGKTAIAVLAPESVVFRHYQVRLGW